MTRQKKNIIFYLLLTTILLIGFFLRTTNLENIPPGLYHDEAYNGLDALSEEYKIFYPNNSGREGLYINLISLSIKIFGVNNFSLRFVSALLGSMTLLGLFLLAKQLKFSKLSILLGVFMLCFSFWHINFSRLALRAVMVPMLLVWIFYLLIKASNKNIGSKKHLLYFSLAGLLTGLGFHTYTAFRMVPLIFIIIAIFLIYNKGTDIIKKYYKELIIFILSALITVLPILIYFYHHPDNFSAHINDLSIFGLDNQNFFQELYKSTTKYMKAFFIIGDSNPRHNYLQLPLLPISWAILFIIGFAISIKKIVLAIVNKSQPKLLNAAILIQSIFWTMLMPGILSNEGAPHFLRIIGIIPAVFLTIMLAIEYLIKIYKKSRFSRKLLHFFAIFMLLIILYNGFSQINIYFNKWAKDPLTVKSMDYNLYVLGKTIKKISLQDNNILIIPSSNKNPDLDEIPSLKTLKFSGQPEINHYSYYASNADLDTIACENSNIILLSNYDKLLKQFLDRCPNLNKESLLNLKSSSPIIILR